MLEKIGNYQIIDRIAETRGYTLLRAWDENRGRNVTIKILKKSYSSLAESARFKQEYNLIHESGCKGIVNSLDLVNYQGSFAVVLEHFNGISLQDHVRQTPPSGSVFLDIAIQLAGNIGGLHEKGIVHRDIKPENILIHPQTNEVRLTNFGLSSDFTGEYATTFHPDVITLRLPYISPEQTGRMNRPVDYRTDLYSLGVTFYYLLTTRLPFVASDPLEIIHAHIAKYPKPPDEIIPGLPEIFSQITLKLMAKTAEERYQNAFGLLHDLRQCRKFLDNEGSIPVFELGKQDFPLMFTIPQKIFGREKELDQLMQSFDYAAGGGRGIVLVSGHPGIGKSTLIQEINKPVTARKGYLIRGKYEQLLRDIPYNGIIQAFRFLIRQILSEDETRIRYFRQRQQKALGSNGKVLTDEFPELELLIGKQPEVPELEPEEKRNRFNHALRSSVLSFCSAEHPMVVFLDDIQWADAASIELIKTVMIDPEQHHILLIAAYRDSEMSLLGSFLSNMEEIRKEGVRISSIQLPPLTVKHVNDLLADFLRCDPEISGPLAGLVHAKTGGNPFFIHQFLKTLHDDQLIKLEPCVGWTWDIYSIKSQQVTDNIARRLEEKISNLPAKVLSIMQVCAAVGERFELELISEITGLSIEESLDNLSLAISMKFIMNVETAYTFQHDRILEAVYALMPEKKRIRLHYRIGKHYLEQTPEDELREKIFTIVNHLNQAIGIITGQEERTNLARLNNIAARRAQNANAYAGAAAYAQTGVSLLPEDAWDTAYEMTYSLYYTCMQCEYLNTRHIEAERLFEIIVRHAVGNADKARAYNIMIILYVARNKLKEAIKLATGYFRHTGVMYKENSTKKDVIIELVKFLLAMRGRAVEDLTRLPNMEDIEWLEQYHLFMSLGLAAYYMNPDLFVIISVKNARLHLWRGTMEGSPIQFTVLAAIFGPALGLHDIGRRFYEVARKLILRFPQNRYQGRFHHIQAFLMHHWHYHAREEIELYRKGHLLSIKYGDFLFGTHSITAMAMVRSIVGDNLTEIILDLQQYDSLLTWIKDEFVLSAFQESVQFIRCLNGETTSPVDMDDEIFDTEAHLQHYNTTQNKLGLFYLRLNQLRLYYLFREYKQAHAIAREMEKIVDVAIGNIQVPEFYFYYALSITGLYRSEPKLRHRGLRRSFMKCMRLMKTWARLCPENYLHKLLLMQAEKTVWIDGKQDKAMRLYQEAMLCARRQGYVQNEGIAAELATELYRKLQYADLAESHATTALRAYITWGSSTKIQDIRQRFQNLFDQATLHDRTAAGRESLKSASPALEGVDIQTVLKISQTISGEIDLQRLIGRMLELAMENAGARVGALLLERDGTLRLEAQTGLTKDQEIPAGIINFVRHTGSYIILDNALEDDTFGRDPVVQERGIRSVLCLPISEQQSQIGVLYLENNLSKKAFTPERIETLKILASQAAISVKNAMLYHERHLTQEQLQAEKERLTVTLRSIGDGVIVTTGEGRISLMNKIAEDLTGWPQALALGRPIEEIFAIVDAAQHMPCGNPIASVVTGEKNFEHPEHPVLVRRDTSERSIEFSVSPIREQTQIIGAIIVFRDISARLKMEEEMLKNQKLESIGIFAGGIAHDFNNLLTAILGTASLVLNSIPAEGKVYERILMLEKAGMQAKGLTQQLLTFAKGGNPIKKTTSIIELLKLSTRFALSGSQVRGETDIDENLWPVEADEGQINQVINNLLINAVQAMPGGGVITLTAKNIVLTNDAALPLNPGEYVLIRVEDQGEGIPPENISKIFDPFFTTKACGNGLGLSSTFSIIQKHGGHITVNSGIGAGTCFSIFLPALKDKTVDASLAQELEKFRATGRVLIMDDNEMILKTGSGMLSQIGFETDQAADGGEAIEKCRDAVNKGRPYTVIILDLTIPGGMGGTDAVRKLRAIDPAAIILASSGYANAPVLSDFAGFGFDGIITKPYRLDELKEALAKALQKKNSHQEDAPRISSLT